MLELSLREAVALKSGSIADGHIALGILRDGEGVAMKMLADRGRTRRPSARRSRRRWGPDPRSRRSAAIAARPAAIAAPAKTVCSWVRIAALVAAS